MKNAKCKWYYTRDPIIINGAAQWEILLLPNTHTTRITLEMPFCIIEVLCGKMSTFSDTQVVPTTICYVASDTVIVVREYLSQ